MALYQIRNISDLLEIRATKSISFLLTLSWKIAIVGEELIRAIKGREGGIEGDRGGETSWRERGGKSGKYLIVIILYQERSTAAGSKATWGASTTASHQ